MVNPEAPKSNPLAIIKATRRQLFAIPPSANRLARLGRGLQYGARVLDMALNGPRIIQKPAEPPEPQEEQKAPENPYAKVDARIREGISLASKIRDLSLRIKTLSGLGKSVIRTNRGSLMLEIHAPIYQIISVNETTTREGWMAIAETFRDGGVYGTAEATLPGPPDAQWHMDTAVHKSERWLKGGKTDPTLDPTKDLAEARKLLPAPAVGNIETWSQYVVAKYKATGECPTGHLATAQDMFDKMVRAKNKSGNTIWTKDEAKQAVALAKAYSETGDSHTGITKVVDQILIFLQSPEIARLKVGAMQQFATDAFNRYQKTPGEEELERARDCARYALNVTSNVRDSTERARLMATVGVDMNTLRIILTDQKIATNPDVIKTLGDLNSAALNAISNAPDMITEAEGFRILGKRLGDLDERSPYFEPGDSYLTFAFARLNECFVDFVNPNMETVSALVAGYRNLVGDFLAVGQIDLAKNALGQMAPFLDQGVNTAKYVEALADIAEAEAKRI